MNYLKFSYLTYCKREALIERNSEVPESKHDVVTHDVPHRATHSLMYWCYECRGP